MTTESELAAVAAEWFPVPDSGRVAYGDRVIVDAYSVWASTQCPGILGAPGEPFVESSRVARRRIGLAALDEMVRPTSGRVPANAVAAVREVIAPGRSQVPDSLASWIDQLDDSGLAQVVADASTWVTAVCAAVGPEQLARLRWLGSRVLQEFRFPDTLVALTARWEAQTEPRPGIGVVLIADRADEPLRNVVEAEHVMCVAAMCGVEVDRVTVVDVRARLLRRVTAEPDSMDAARSRIVRVLDAVSSPDDVELSPGPHCRFCGSAPECPALR